MAVEDPTPTRTTYPATDYFLRGVARDVTHTSGGKAVTREAIVNIETWTFKDKGGSRKVSTASCTFLDSIGVEPEDTVSLPNEETPRKVLKRTSAYAPYWPPRGYTTTVLLA